MFIFPLRSQVNATRSSPYCWVIWEVPFCLRVCVCVCVRDVSGISIIIEFLFSGLNIVVSMFVFAKPLAVCDATLNCFTWLLASLTAPACLSVMSYFYMRLPSLTGFPIMGRHHHHGHSLPWGTHRHRQHLNDRGFMFSCLCCGGTCRFQEREREAKGYG